MKKFISILLTVLVIVLPLFCKGFQSSIQPSSEDYYGIWLLNREKTLEHMLAKRGRVFSSLSTEEQSRMIKTFPFDIIVEFDRNGNWRGSFLDNDGTMNNGNGNYTSKKKDEHSYQVSVEEKSGEGSFANNFIVIIQSKKEINIILGGKETIDLILHRTKIFMPINERHNMESPETQHL
jgi:hypothetical protein